MKRKYQKKINKAISGDIHEQYVLGSYYLKTDLYQSFYWYTLSATGGNANAQFQLAMFYEMGLIVKASIKDALYWYRKAFENGIQEAKIKIDELERE